MICMDCGEKWVKGHKFICPKKNIKTVQLTIGIVLADIPNARDQIEDEMNIFCSMLNEIPGVRDVQVIGPLKEF